MRPPAADDDDYDSDFDLAEAADVDDDGDAATPLHTTADGWTENNGVQFSQLHHSDMESDREPRLAEGFNASASIFEYGKLFLPMAYLRELAEKMQANGKAKHDNGKGDIHYQAWTVTLDDVLQWIGIWMYMLAFHHPGGRESFFQPPDGDFGPTHDIHKWLKIGCPNASRGIFWFNQMQACFELPTYNKPEDPFNRTRKFWDALRDGFWAAITCSWIACLDESMVKWLGRGMPGFMHVQRKPTPKGLELHTLCCGICGILIWFEVFEGKKAMETKGHCAEQKRLLGANGPWKSVSLSLRMAEKLRKGTVLVADSWFGSKPCILALYSIGIFAVMCVKTAHKGFPKDALLGKLGYDAKTKLCPKARRGEYYGYTQKFDTPAGRCEVLGAGHNSKKPVLLISTASTMAPAPDYAKTWTWTNALGELVKYTIRVPTTMVHALYHKYFNKVDVHNHLRQGLVSMADVWATKDWAHRHFAEGLGFWEVNVFMAITRWHLDYANMGHGKFRIRLAHAFMTLGKVPFTAGHAAAVTAVSELHKLKKFGNYDSEHHQCGFCPKGIHGYFYCDTCFPDGRATHALCNPSKGRDCYAKHVAGEKPAHGCRIQIAK